VVYVLENNMYAIDTCIAESCKLANLSDRAKGYGIPSQTVDGNDVLAVYEAVGKAVTRARKSLGPTLIECKTYRHHGHAQGAPQAYYRTKEEVEEWMKKDPIPRYRKLLFDMGILTEKDANKIDQTIAEEIEKAVNFAQTSPYPAPEETLADVYA
jgi:pyruvate dehydrogenase E1 component alpha subunit